MAAYPVPDKVKIVYFTGTGCTALAAGELSDALRRRGVTVYLEELNVHKTPERQESEALLILLYPVYAFNAPEPVYDYIKKHGNGQNLPAAVISVSGGGEVTPNKASRKHAIRLLEKQGFRVVYERMLVTPSNILTPTPFDTSVTLLQILPKKAEKIAEDLTTGVYRRTRPGLINSALASFGELQKLGAKQLSKRMSAGAACTGCGLCWLNCPTGNITPLDSRPRFGNDCAMCLKCLYRCPQKAIESPLRRFLTYQEGCELSDIVRAAALSDQSRNTELPKSLVWIGLKKYINERD